MDVSVRELRHHTARVIEAIESGEPVVLTKHGRPVADITPRTERSESRPMHVVFRELEELRQQWIAAREAGEAPPVADGYRIKFTTDDFIDDLERTYR